MNYDLVMKKQSRSNKRHKKPKWAIVRHLGACKTLQDAREAAILALRSVEQSGDPRYAVRARSELRDRAPKEWVELPTRAQASTWLSEMSLVPEAVFYLQDEDGEILDFWRVR
jgi:hypothetical protein